MKSFKFWQQRQHTSKAKYLPSWLISAGAALLIPGYLLVTSVSSNAGETAEIFSTKGYVWVKPDGGSRTPAKPGESKLRHRQDAMFVEGGGSSLGKIVFTGCKAQGGADPDPSMYKFPSLVRNKWTILMDKGRCKGVLFKLRENSSAHLPRTKQTRFATDAIQILLRDETALIQTDEQTDGNGRRLIVDVLLGSVIINSPQRQGEVLRVGQRYTYFVDGQRDDKVDIRTATDCGAVNEFLSSEGWPTDVAAQIATYSPQIGRFCPQEISPPVIR